jgi:membrane protein DedA with SNARE-associated domain
VFDGLLELVSASPWTYAAIFAIAALDAVIPLVPSETAVLSAGVLAGTGDLSLVLVISAAAGGALVGDNCAYSIGRFLGPRLEPRIARSERARGPYAWARQKLVTEGGTLLLAARFVPGGRTATTVTSGILRLRWRRFLVLTFAAGTAWATGIGLLGYAGGHAVEENPYLGLPLLLGVAVLVCALTALVKRLRRRSDEAPRPASASVGLAMPQIRVRLLARRLGA